MRTPSDTIARDQRQRHDESDDGAHWAPLRSASSASASSSSDAVEFVADTVVVVVGRPSDPTVLDVVLDEVVTGELMGATGEREQEQREPERDDDRRERQRLGKRIGRSFAVEPVGERSVARPVRRR